MTPSIACSGRLSGEKSTLELLTTKPTPLAVVIVVGGALDSRLGFAGARTDTSRADADIHALTPPRDTVPNVLDRRFSALNATETLVVVALSRLPASSSSASFHTPPLSPSLLAGPLPLPSIGLPILGPSSPYASSASTQIGQHSMARIPLRRRRRIASKSVGAILSNHFVRSFVRSFVRC